MLPPSAVITPVAMHSLVAQSRARGELPMLCVYDSPSDYPGCIVARLFIVAKGKSCAQAYCMIAKDLEWMRAMMPRDMVPMQRSAGDDACIVETWI